MTERVVGTITSTGFASGDQFVVGRWETTPVGAFGDVMWRSPSGHRTLFASSDAAAEYITAIYAFDQVMVVDLSVVGDRRSTTVESARLSLQLRSGRRRPIPLRRPRAVTRWIEAPIARRLMGVEVHGTSPLGVREWYQSSGWSWIDAGRGELDGADLGGVTRLEHPMGVGFSDPPPRPSIVSVRVAIER